MEVARFFGRDAVVIIRGLRLLEERLAEEFECLPVNDHVTFDERDNQIFLLLCGGNDEPKAPCDQNIRCSARSCVTLSFGVGHGVCRVDLRFHYLLPIQCAW